MSSNKGVVIHVMGYYNSGKQKLCDSLFETLLQQTNKNITYINDEVKKNLSYGLRYNLEDRKKQIERLGYISYEIARNGGLIIFYSNYPYFRERDSIKKKLDIEGHLCVNVYLDTPLSVCKERDETGIYLLAENGKLQNIPGVDEKYENPNDYDLILSDHDSNKHIEIIVKYIKDYI